MRALRAAACLVGMPALVLLAGGAPERDIYITVSLQGEPPPSDTVLVSCLDVMPSNVAPGQEDVAALCLSLKRISLSCDGPLHLTGLRFVVGSLDGLPIDAYDVISLIKIRIDGGLVPAKGNPSSVGSEAPGIESGDGRENAGLVGIMLSEPALLSSLDSLTVEILLRINPRADEPGFTITMAGQHILLTHDKCSGPVVVTWNDDAPGGIAARTTIIPGTPGGSFSNFPNPFAAGREITTFAFFLPRRAEVGLKLYTGFGRLVKTLEFGKSRGGGRVHEDITWDGRDDSGAVLQNGTYFAVLTVRYEDGATERFLRKVAVLR